MHFWFMLSKIFFLLESFITLFALERLFEFFKKPSSSFFCWIHDWVLIISVDHNITELYLFCLFTWSKIILYYQHTKVEIAPVGLLLIVHLQKEYRSWKEVKRDNHDSKLSEFEIFFYKTKGWKRGKFRCSRILPQIWEWWHLFILRHDYIWSVKLVL